MKWINVKDELPHLTQKIVAYTKRNGVQVGFHLGWKVPSIQVSPKDFQYTHWMPLPNPPKENKNEN